MKYFSALAVLIVAVACYQTGASLFVVELGLLIISMLVVIGIGEFMFAVPVALACLAAAGGLELYRCKLYLCILPIPLVIAFLLWQASKSWKRRRPKLRLYKD